MKEKFCEKKIGRNFEAAMGTDEGKKDDVDFAFYSKVLNKPFGTLAELRDAEEAHVKAIKKKEADSMTKKEEATKVEQAFKTLNAARKVYKEQLTKLTQEYSKHLNNLKSIFDCDRNNIKDELAAAEKTYSEALKNFTDKYPEGFHITLKDGDFESTISKKRSIVNTDPVSEMLSMFFGF